MTQDLWHGDCLELMANIPDGTVDLVLCDLPFGVTQNEWDTPLPLPALWQAYKRIIKPTGVVALNAMQPFSSALVVSNPDWFKYEWIWEKNKSSGFLNAKHQPLRSHESILIFYQGLPIYNAQKTFGHSPVHANTKHTSCGTNYGKTKIGLKGGGATDRYPKSILRFPVVNGDSPDRCHPTQKPVALCEYLIKTYTHEGGLVLDNCCGSGSTLVAARGLGRAFIGIEKNSNYYAAAKRRLGEPMSRQQSFDEMSRSPG